MAGKFSLQPLEDRVVVRPIEEEDTTASGLVIPDTAKERPQEGEVIAVGPGRFEDGQRIPMDVKVGDKVIYSKYGGTEVKIEGEEMTVSGIVIPDTAKEKPQEGKVVAVGPGRFEDGARVPLDVAVGDTVIYSKYGGTEVKVESDEYLILSARDVLAVVKK